MKQVQALNDLKIAISFLMALKHKSYSCKAVNDYIDSRVYPYLKKTLAELEIKQKPRRS